MTTCPFESPRMSAREIALVRIAELREGARWSLKTLWEHIDKTYPGSQGDLEKLTVENLRALGNHLAGQQPAKVV